MFVRVTLRHPGQHVVGRGGGTVGGPFPSRGRATHREADGATSRLLIDEAGFEALRKKIAPIPCSSNGTGKSARRRPLPEREDARARVARRHAAAGHQPPHGAALLHAGPGLSPARRPPYARPTLAGVANGRRLSRFQSAALPRHGRDDLRPGHRLRLALRPWSGRAGDDPQGDRRIGAEAGAGGLSLARRLAGTCTTGTRCATAG